ncbi:MAG: DNA polymerase III subunit gamma/tau [Rikenellaceae bacterium]|nr:DNA polymerase III subunit gamma/tau [Rikenellaceae bacterium]
MSDFIVSARKYRPATFASVVGQKHITSTLKNAIERGQLAHAYLFCGPRGVGKTTCARIFAKAINCLEPNGAEACNRCESCSSFNEGRSLNIHELDAASNNSVEDIRNLIDQVRIIPQIGRYSVFIIDEVHMLSAAAFNAFLKTLEEPPQHAIFILATTEKHKIIPTILSRCQIYDFNRIRVEDAVEYLRYIASQEGVTADEESLNLIAQKADGGMRDALSMFDKAVSFCGTNLDYHSVAQTLNVLDYDTYFGMTDLLLAGRYTEALIAFDAVLSKGFSGQTFLSGMNRHLRDLLMARQPDTLRLIEMTGTLMERYRTQAAACDPEFLFGAISILTELDGKIRQASNSRLSVELGLMKIARLGQKKNEGIASDEEYYPLPELIPQPAPAQEAVQPAVQEAVRSTTQEVTVRPVAQEAVRPTTQTAAQTTMQPAPQPAVPPSSQEPSRPMSQAAPAVHPTTTTQPHSTPRRGSLGTSLTAMLAQQGRPTASKTAPEEASEGPAEPSNLDPKTEQKLRIAQQSILNWIKAERPRFYPAFERMELRFNGLAISVPSKELHDEIVRNKTALLTQIARMGAIEGGLELEVTINEEIRAERPIKLEDRLRYLTELNPLIGELRRELEMEVE